MFTPSNTPPVSSGPPASANAQTTAYPTLHSGGIGAFAWRSGRTSVPLVDMLECVSADVSMLRQKASNLNAFNPLNNGFLGPLSAVALSAIRIGSLRVRLFAQTH